MPFYRSVVHPKGKTFQDTSYTIEVGGEYLPISAGYDFYGGANYQNRPNWDFRNLTNNTVVIGDYVECIAYLFYQCVNFNGPVIFGKNVLNCFRCLTGCSNFNQPLNLPANLNNCVYLLDSCSNFNSQVQFGNNIVNAYSMFSYCYNFNQPLILPESLRDASRMLSDCRNFNQTINITENLSNAAYMFNNCANLYVNLVKFPLTSNIVEGTYMFYNTHNPNFPVVLNLNCNFMSLVNSGGMFNCRLGVLNVTLPSTLVNAGYMFACHGTNNICNQDVVGDIYVKYNPSGNYYRMVHIPFIRGSSSINTIDPNRPALNIHSSVFNNQWVYFGSGVNMNFYDYGPNCMYNPAYNVYLYNNYS